MIKAITIFALIFFVAILALVGWTLCKAAQMADELEEKIHREYFDKEHKNKEEDF